MKTYLVLYFGTKEKPSEIALKLEKLGFLTSYGPYDFVYDWGKKPSTEEILRLGDRIADSLKDSGVIFNLDTHD